MPRSHIQRLLNALASTIGRESAKQELKWIQQTGRTDLEAMLRRRTMGEPLQYILGTQPFGPLELITRAPTLIPRPETENWTMRLSELLTPTPAKPLSVLDLCTGTGCIPLLLCHLWPPGSTRAYGVDISDSAVKLANENAAKCGIPAGPFVSISAASDEAPQVETNTTTNTNVFAPFKADVLDPGFTASLGPLLPFDVITSNPPYIPLAEYHMLPRSVRDYEDRGALLGDPLNAGIAVASDGLTFYRAIARLVARPGILSDDDRAIVILEVGDKQASAVESILRTEAGLPLTEIWRDPWGKERVVVGRRR